ncbi:MAG: DUF2778 domain-containing protein [Proteobacteria bacterium]|nr:DUF2778 domain-containing protein [Pseudomonadota bacterium]
MENRSTDNRIWTRVSGDGKSAAAGMSLGSDGGSASGTKTGAGGKPQPYGWHGYYGETGGGASNGPVCRGKVTLPNEVRGTVAPPAQKGKVVPPPPPAPRQPHLIYSQSTGEMAGPDGKPLATGYAGRGGGQNNPDAEGIKGVGPLPQGNWRVEEYKTTKWPDRSYKLTPDEETRKRVEALGRDPDSFYIHAKARNPESRGRESWGCIALDKAERDKLKSYEKRWIRVER